MARLNLSKQQKDRVAEIADTVKRESRQPSMTTRKDAQDFFASTYSWVKEYERREVAYTPESKARDTWLREFALEEPHLASVLSTSISLDVNRTFTLTGGRNQVLRYGRRLGAVENGEGWRQLKSLSSRDFYSTDIGSITEIERDGIHGPMLSLYHVDSARCQLTGGNPPLEYKSKGFKPQLWEQDWYYRLSSMPNPDEEYYNLGYCAISRCVKIAQIMIAVVTYDLEKLGHLSPRGLLLIESEGMTPEMWEEATTQREQLHRQNTGNKYYDNLMVLVDRSIKAQLINIAGLPDKFDPFTFTDYMMKAYALAFNRDVRAFWAVNSGSFGGGTEAGLQYERATQGGIIDYAVADQEQLQKILPSTLLFQYDVDDTRGKLLKAELEKKWTEVGKDLQDIGLPLPHVLSKLADEGVIDKDWTMFEEETMLESDENIVRMKNVVLIQKFQLEEKRRLALKNEAIQRAVYRYQDEPIISWTWPDNKIEVLWNAGSDAIKKTYRVSQMPWLETSSRKFRARKQRGAIEGANINTRAFTQLVELGIANDVSQNELRERMQITMSSMTFLAYLSHVANKTPEQNRINLAASSILNGGYVGKPNMSTDETRAYEANKDVLTASSVFTQLSNDEKAQGELSDIIENTNSSLFPDKLYGGEFEDANDTAIKAALALWLFRVGYSSEMGKVFETEATYQWVVGSTDHCGDCAGNAGVIKTSSEWRSTLLPKSSSLQCQGWRCQCYLQPV
jgi:hypothetical protein